MAALAVGCGSPGANGNPDGSVPNDGRIPDGNNTDADPDVVPPPPPPACSPGSAQCNDCIDNDDDGLIDGFDPHCTSALDNDESSFATGIPGDNIDAVWQDCFFDGNSGHGNDGCNLHVCCLLGATSKAECPSHLKPQQFDPNQCTVNQKCIDTCGPLSPPGCDCFGCCTLCNDTGCYDILTNPNISPNCDLDTLHDPEICKPCTKIAGCGTECNPSGCILCPGQTEDDLPPECNGENVCPGGLTTCESSTDCQSYEFCANGCCIAQVN